MSLFRVRILDGSHVIATWDRFADSEHAAACSTLAAALKEWPERRATLAISEPELLPDPADLVRDLVAARPAPGFNGRCDYCGLRCHGHTCAAHRDLPQLEHDSTPINEKTPQRLLAETSAAGPNRKEG